MTAFDWDSTTDFFTSDWTETIQISGTNYTAIRYDRKYSRHVVEAGLSNEIRMSYMLRTADFVTLPYRGNPVVISSVTYRIQSVTVDSTNKTFTIDLTENYA